MKIAQTHRAGSISARTVYSTSEKLKPVLRGLMRRIGFVFLASTFAILTATSASTGEPRDEAAVRALGDGFAKAFVQKNPDLRASLFTDNGTFVTPQGDFIQGHVAMVKDFGAEGQAVNSSTQAAFSDYRIRFIKPDVAVADALLTFHNVSGPDGQVIPVIPVNFFFVAVRHGDHWLIEDGRAHFAPAPANSMASPQ